MGSDVVIIGAGVIGLSSALRCADAGLSVTLVDPAPGRGASWAAAGMLAPVAELHYGEDALLRLNLSSSERWPDWAASLADRGADVGYVPCGSLMVARDADDTAELRRLMDTQARLGLQVEWLRGREARQAKPPLAPSTHRAVRVAGDHQVDNRALVRGLQALAVDSPLITVRVGTVTAVTTAGDRATGVTLDDCGDLVADTVVLCAGAGSSAVEGLVGLLPAVRPVKGQLLHLRSPSGPLARANLRGLEVYIVNRPDGRIVVGATVEERGFDTQVTAGGVSELLRKAWELLPGIDECAFVEATAGLRPATPDNAPVIGRVAGLSGVVLATGHYRNGVLLSPLTADAVAALATGSPVPDEVAPFGPVRFDPAPV
ncbi:glycine oxidase ThiO [soil metagenome]